MSDRYKITVEEDNSSDAATWIIIAALIVSCFIFIGIPLLIGYIIYRIIKHNRQQKAMAGLKCPTCGRSDALRTFKSEMICSTPKQIYAHAKSAAGTRSGDVMTVTEQTWRHYEKCRFCGAIQYWDDKKEV